MALSKLFQRIFWNNNTAPALNDTNLNAMSKAIDDIDDRVIELAADVIEKVPELEDLAEQLEEGIQNPPYIGANGNWYIWNTTTQQYVDSGVDASISVNIADVTMLAEGATPYVTNTGTSTDPVFHLFVPIGATGATGQTGATPNISISATADATSSDNPSVQVTPGGTAAAPTFALAFSGLKGTKGDTGNTGATGADGVSPGVTITTITGGHRVTITDKDHPNGQNFDVMDGTGSGDMQASTYDPQGDVAAAGGIPDYVSGKMDKANPTGTGALSLNRKANTTVGVNSVAIGTNTTASGDYSYAAGDSTTASAFYAHAEGYNTTASEECAHAEGSTTTASGYYSHAEGYNTTASGGRSHASGTYTIAGYAHQHVCGKYNSNKSTTLFEVGNGTATNARSNAFEVYSDGSLSTDNGTTKTKLPAIKTATLAASATTVSFANMPTTGTHLIDFYTSVPGLNYTAIATSDGGATVTLTYDAQSSAVTVYAKITEVTS